MKNYLTGESLYTKLCEMGASRWTKGNHDRIYLNRAGRDLLGLTLEHYNTGNIRSAELNGEPISNGRARELCAWLETVYYDCKTGKLCWRAGTCPNNDYAADLLDAINTIESDETTASETSESTVSESDDDPTPESDETTASETSESTAAESGDITTSDSNETPAPESDGDPTPESSKTTIPQETKTGAAAKSSDGPVPHETAVPSTSARRSASGSSAAASTPGDPHPRASAPVSTPASPSAPPAAAALIHAPAP